MFRDPTLSGPIERDRRANMVLLDRNPFEVSPTDLQATAVLETLFEGRIVFER